MDKKQNHERTAKAIAEILDGDHDWNADTVERIARLLVEEGYATVEGPGGWFTTTHHWDRPTREDDDDAFWGDIVERVASTEWKPGPNVVEWQPGTPVKHTAQEWFGLAWERAKLKQRSTKGGEGLLTCTYERTETTPGCFIGVGLPRAAQQHFAVQNNPASSLVEHGDLVVTDMPRDTAAAFLNRLQRTHDSYRPEKWDGELRQAAAYYGLEIPGGGR